MINCPKCETPVDGDTCPQCGYTEASAATKRNANRLQCAHEDRGERCANAGAFSMGLSGGGPWYCRQHIDQVRGRSETFIDKLDEEGRERVRGAIAQLAEQLRTPPVDTKRWARDIIELYQQGEYTNIVGIEKAHLALRMELPLNVRQARAIAEAEADEERIAIQEEGNVIDE